MSKDNKYRNGKIYTIAGNGEAGHTMDGIPACKSKLNGPAGLAIDMHDNIYIAEIHNHAVRKIDAQTKLITTVAGCGKGGFDRDGKLSVESMLNGPEGVFVDVVGNIYIADTYNQRIRKVDVMTGIIDTIAGCGEAGYNGDHILARNAMLNEPAGVVVDSMGNVYFNDYRNDRVRRIDLNGIITTYAGTGVSGYSGDGGAADKAQISDVYGLAIDRDDNIYIMDSLNFAVRKVDAQTKVISTVVGKGVPGTITEFERVSDCCIGSISHEKGTIGMEAPHAVEILPNGNILIADTGHSRIRMVDLSQDCVYTVAGNGIHDYAGDHGKAIDAALCIHGLRADSSGNIYFVDFVNHVLRVVQF